MANQQQPPRHDQKAGQKEGQKRKSRQPHPSHPDETGDEWNTGAPSSAEHASSRSYGSEPDRVRDSGPRNRQ